MNNTARTRRCGRCRACISVRAAAKAARHTGTEIVLRAFQAVAHNNPCENAKGK